MSCDPPGQACDAPGSIEATVELEFKLNFEEARQRWAAFWEGEHTDRPLLSIVVPKPGVEPIDKPRYMAGADGNYDEPIDQLLGWARTHDFLAEAIPFFNLEFCPDHFSLLLGAERETNPASPNTSWAVPFVTDWDTADIRFRRDGKWWSRTVEFAQALRAKCDGKLLIAAPTLVGGLDALAAVRGPNQLMTDLATEPEKVTAALDRVCSAYRDILDAFAELLDFDGFGSINRHGMYSRGRINVPQCDASCMISDRMYREFGIPSLKREMGLLDAAEYHLDGPGAIRHLEALCELDDLDIVQWVPGSGEAEHQDWTDLYRRIDALGKGQMIGTDRERIAQFWGEFRSRKLFFHTSAVSQEDAADILSGLEKPR